VQIVSETAQHIYWSPITVLLFCFAIGRNRTNSLGTMGYARLFLYVTYILFYFSLSAALSLEDERLGSYLDLELARELSHRYARTREDGDQHRRLLQSTDSRQTHVPWADKSYSSGTTSSFVLTWNVLRSIK
jgi:hypothetical protein